MSLFAKPTDRERAEAELAKAQNQSDRAAERVAALRAEFAAADPDDLEAQEKAATKLAGAELVANAAKSRLDVAHQALLDLTKIDLIAERSDLAAKLSIAGLEDQIAAIVAKETAIRLDLAAVLPLYDAMTTQATTLARRIHELDTQIGDRTPEPIGSSSIASVAASTARRRIYDVLARQLGRPLPDYVSPLT